MVNCNKKCKYSFVYIQTRLDNNERHCLWNQPTRGGLQVYLEEMEDLLISTTEHVIQLGDGWLKGWQGNTWETLVGYPHISDWLVRGDYDASRQPL